MGAVMGGLGLVERKSWQGEVRSARQIRRGRVVDRSRIQRPASSVQPILRDSTMEGGRGAT